MEVQHLPLAFGESCSGLLEQGLEVGGRHAAGHVLLRCLVETGIGVEQRAGAGPMAVLDLVAGDGVHPRPEAVGVAELADTAADEQHRVVDDVGSLVGVAEASAGEVVKTVGVAVVERRQGRRIAGQEAGDEIPVVSHRTRR